MKLYDLYLHKTTGEPVLVDQQGNVYAQKRNVLGSFYQDPFDQAVDAYEREKAAEEQKEGGGFLENVGNFFNDIWTNESGEPSTFQNLFNKYASNISFSDGKVQYGGNTYDFPNSSGSNGGGGNNQASVSPLVWVGGGLLFLMLIIMAVK